MNSKAGVGHWIAGLVAAALLAGPAVAATPEAAESAAPAFRDAGAGIAIGPFRLLPSLGLSFGYDDNLALSAEDEESSTFWRLSPGVRLERGSERSRLHLTLDADIGRYADSALDDYDDYGALLGWSYNPLARHGINLDVGRRFRHDERGTAAREGELGQLDLDVDRLRRDELGGRYRFGAPGARGRLEFDARFGDTHYFNNRQFTAFRDRDDLTLGGAFYWRMAPKTSALLRLERADFDYDLATLDSRETHAFVGVEFDATAKTTGAIMVGRMRKAFDDPLRDDYSGSSWRANLEWRPRSYSVINLTSGGETDETNGFGDYILRRDLTAGWRHSWSARFATSLDAGVAREEQRPTTREDDLRFYGISADYAFRRWLRAGLSWRNFDRDSDVPEFDYRRNVFLLSLEANL